MKGKGTQCRLTGRARSSTAQGKERGGGVWLGPNWAVRRRAVRAEQAGGRGRGGAGLGWSGGFVSRVSAQGRLGVLVSICI